MGAALYPVNQKPTEMNGAGRGGRERSKVSPFERPQEQSLSRALGVISELEAELTDLVAELSELREALARTGHKIACQDQLLRNALIRERELRSQLGGRLG
ncbi:MAG: hypothetical protein ABI882_03750 [Acidobacteriota bacterium]